MPELQNALLTWVLNATLFLAAGLAAALVLRRRAPLAHAALLLALLMVLALPILSWGVRRAGAGILPPAPARAPITTSAPVITLNAAAASSSPSAATPSVQSPSPTNLQNSQVSTPPAPLHTSSGVSLLCWTAYLLWAALSLAVFLRLCHSLLRGVRLRRASAPCENPSLRRALDAACTAVNLPRPVALHRCERVTCPMICCWGTPCVLVPSGAPAGVDWRSVMVHELAHFLRRDHLSALVAELVCCVLPWHPLAWLARRNLAAAAELACDDWALRHAACNADYAGSLVAFAAPRAGIAIAPAILSRVGVSARVARVLSALPGPVRLGPAAAATVLFTAIAAGAVASLAQPAPSAPAAASKPEPSSDRDPIESFLDLWRRAPESPERKEIWQQATKLGESKDPRIIPAMIGVIDADNSYNTVYGVGYFGLGGITGVRYSPFHDGPWWRRWWDANKSRFPTATAPIPDLPKSPHGRTYTPFPQDLDTFDGKVRWLLKEYEQLRAGNSTSLGLSDIAGQLASHADPRAIPTMIGVIDADNSYETVYGVGYFGLGELTGVRHSAFHDGAWWRRWWDANKSKFPLEAQQVPIPDLPKTKHGETYKPYPADLDTYDGLARQLLNDYSINRSNRENLSDIAQSFVRLGDLRCIPTMIGVIDADNSYETIYDLGYFGLGSLTKVSYSPYHDGPWWRRWWDANKSKFPLEAQQAPIPDLPKTAFGKTYTPMPASFDTFDGKVAWLNDALASGRDIAFDQFAQALAEHHDDRAIPLFIGLMEADNTERTIYGVGYFGMQAFTGGKNAKHSVTYDKSHDGAWWRRWWEENKSDYSAPARQTPIPDLKAPFAAWAAGEQSRRQVGINAQFEGLPLQDLRAGGDDHKRYFLMGPAQAQKMPEKGWKLLLILPGGGGGDDFQSFCRTIHRDALPEGFVAAELVAPQWSQDPNRTVWPTRMLNGDKAPFTTEDFIRAVVTDAATRLTIDRSTILALAWSSSGPALYCDSLQPDTPVTGWLIAMSVFRPQWMPDLAAAKNHRYYILHSPGDKLIPIDEHARTAEKRLRDAGAVVTLAEYSGGHGWTDDPIAHIRRGVEWLLSDHR